MALHEDYLVSTTPQSTPRLAGARMPVLAANQPPDPVALRRAADGLAELLNDLKMRDWHLLKTRSDCWEIIQAPGGVTAAKAVVIDGADGLWRTGGVIQTQTTEQSLAARLRSIASELEQLVQG